MKEWNLGSDEYESHLLDLNAAEILQNAEINKLLEGKGTLTEEDEEEAENAASSMSSYELEAEHLFGWGS